MHYRGYSYVTYLKHLINYLIMPRTPNSKGIRFEIWPELKDVQFIKKHLCSEGISAKQWMQDLIAEKVAKERKKIKELPLHAEVNG
jgi:hypothetical protein